MLVLRDMQRRERSICSPIERVVILARVMGGKPSAGRLMLAAVLWKSETRWWRLPVVGRGERGVGMLFLRGTPAKWCWEAMVEHWLGNARPKQQSLNVYERRSCTERHGVEKCSGGEEGSGSVSNYYNFFVLFFLVFF